MKFDEKYPNAAIGDQFNDMVLGIGGDTAICWNCKERTAWIEINFETYLCSEECLAQKEREYIQALRDSSLELRQENEDEQDT